MKKHCGRNPDCIASGDLICQQLAHTISRLRKPNCIVRNAAFMTFGLSRAKAITTLALNIDAPTAMYFTYLERIVMALTHEEALDEARGTSTCDNINCAEMIEELTAERNALTTEVTTLRRLIEAAEAVREVDCSIFCCDKETWTDFCGALDDAQIDAATLSGTQSPQFKIAGDESKAAGWWYECCECGDELQQHGGDGGVHLECGQCGHEWYEGELLHKGGLPIDGSPEPKKPNHIECRECGEGCRFGGAIRHKPECSCAVGSRE